MRGRNFSFPAMQRWDFFGSGPAAAYARQLKGSRSGRPGSLVVRGNQSRRDLTKVDDMSRQLTAPAAKLSGSAFSKSHPSRTGRSTNAGNRRAGCQTKSRAFLSSLAPKAFGAYGTDLSFASFPSTSSWATFTESLRDKSPHRTILTLKLTRMGGCRIPLGFWRSSPKRWNEGD